MNRTTVNQEVNVTGYYFRQNTMQPVPSSIEYAGRQVKFANQSMQYLIRKGQQFIKLFDVTDGDTTYRLKYDPEKVLWTLVYTSGSRIQRGF